MRQTKITLTEKELPRKWYNIKPDMPNRLLPALHPGTQEPVDLELMSRVFPPAIIEQEVSREQWIDIPDEVLDIYTLWRPTPLYRAHRLEQALGTPARIYYKHEGVSPTGSHKPNTAVAQAFYNKQAGIRRVATETGAGQWGVAMAFGGVAFGLAVTVYMVRVSCAQKPYRRSLMETWGATVHPSPSTVTATGRKILEADPDCPGSIGIAVSESSEDAALHADTNHAVSSVMSHVCLHQTVIGIEAKKQMEIAGEEPDIVIGCCGGGSNLAGMGFPFVRDKINGRDLRVLAVEPSTCPTLTRGEYRYDLSDTAGRSPFLHMYTIGHDFIPPAIHAAGLRYHGVAPLVSRLVADKLIEARAYAQKQVFEAALLFASTEGIVPAPEAAHAVRAAIDEARRCTEEGRQRTILFCLSGNGYLDMQAYADYLAGTLADGDDPDEQIGKCLARLPRISTDQQCRLH